MSDNFPLDHVRSGSGEPLLLIQGMSGHHRLWGRPFLDLLEQDFEVLVYDHRGIGESARGEERFSVSDLADDAASLLEHVGWDSAHVLGISLGGMVAQELVLRHPGRVRTLTLGCTTAGGPAAFDAPGPARMVEAMQSRDAERSVRAGFEANLSADYRGRDGAWEEFRDTVLSVRVPVDVVVHQSVAALGHDVADRLGAVSVPTVVVHGVEDEMILVREGERLAELVPEAALERWDGVGHLFWWEQPGRSADLLRKHLGPRG